jgi:hypothetical protein
MGACQHNLHGQARLVGVTGAEGLERLDSGGEAALAVFGFVDNRRRQAMAEFGVIFVLGDGGEGGEGGYWLGSGLVIITDGIGQYN